MVARIIVIENDEAIREFLTIGLKDEGWEVFSYDYAHITLSSLMELRPDLIILDVHKQGGEVGWSFLQMLKMEDTTAKIPILITTTAFQLSAEIRAYLLTRFIRVVNKPFDLDLFIPLVKKTLALAIQSGVIFSSDRILPILVVEDIDYLREALTTILRLEGYQMVTAENGLVALQAVYDADHCLILLDIQMPVMDGYEFLKIYDRQLRPHTPVVVLSAKKEILTEVLPAFVIDVIPKPYEVSHLLQVVSKYAQPV